jgi:hypothetical protein
LSGKEVGGLLVMILVLKEKHGAIERVQPALSVG